MMQLLKIHAFPKEDNRTSCKNVKKIMLHNIADAYKVKSAGEKIKLYRKLFY